VAEQVRFNLKEVFEIEAAGDWWMENVFSKLTPEEQATTREDLLASELFDPAHPLFRRMLNAQSTKKPTGH
jgi:hypothetical protein